MVFFEGYAERVGRKTGGGSLAEEKGERGRDFPLRPCFTVLHRQVTDFPPLGSRGGDFSISQTAAFLPRAAPAHSAALLPARRGPSAFPGPCRTIPRAPLAGPEGFE